ncbi:MAG: hypothetical protein ABIA11_00230 [Patescibacteria group bacterium]|nr:hypothetical protein [Patescibacteria group bacterium]
MSTTIAVESVISRVLNIVRGKQVPHDVAITIEGPRLVGSLSLTGKLEDHGDATVFLEIPEQDFLQYDQKEEDKFGRKYGAMIIWEGSQWVFAEGRAWKDGKPVDDAEETQKVRDGWICWIAKRQLEALINKDIGFASVKRLIRVLNEYLETDIKMYQQLSKLINGPFNVVHVAELTGKGKGTLEYYAIPDKNVEEVKKLLNVAFKESAWARCQNQDTGYKSEVTLELFIPEEGNPTAQLIGTPWNQTYDPLVNLTGEVSLV